MVRSGRSWQGWAVGVLGGALLGMGLGACGSSAPASQPISGRPTSSSSGSASSGSSGTWPALVTSAMAQVVGRTTGLPLEAPRVLPGPAQGPGAANSATVQARAQSYAVDLYACPEALPVNSPGIGVGSCGALDQYVGSFGGQAEGSQAAALAALPAAAGAPPSGPSGACPSTSQVDLGSGVRATVRATAGGPCSVVWQQGAWQVHLLGDLSDWTPLGRQIAQDLEQQALPGTRGELFCDIAPDGDHTSLAWLVGTDLYQASVYHAALPTLALARAMAPYPARGSSR